MLQFLVSFTKNQFLAWLCNSTVSDIRCASRGFDSWSGHCFV